jgi:hypothetical protein
MAFPYWEPIAYETNTLYVRQGRGRTTPSVTPHPCHTAQEKGRRLLSNAELVVSFANTGFQGSTRDQNFATGTGNRRVTYDQTGCKCKPRGGAVQPLRLATPLPYSAGDGSTLPGTPTTCCHTRTHPLPTSEGAALIAVFNALRRACKSRVSSSSTQGFSSCNTGRTLASKGDVKYLLFGRSIST